MSLAIAPAKKSKLKNANGNKVQPEDRAIHDWYRFVLSFPPHLVRDYLQKLEAKRDACVLDPFAGTGTTILEAKRSGFEAIGIESHPMGHFASSVKIDWGIKAEKLVQQAEQITEAVANRMGLKSMPREFLALYDEGVSLRSSQLLQLPEEEAHLLLKDSISPKPLHKVLALREAIERIATPRLKRHLRLALATTAVIDASNLHFGPEVGLGEIREDAPVIQSWLQRVYSMASDLRQVDGHSPAAHAFRGDAREPAMLAPRSVDVVITSPPYPNEKDYTRTTRLETVLMGFLRNREDLRALKQGLLRSNTRNVYKHDDDDRWIAPFQSVQRVAAAIERRRLELGKTSGFERLYHRVTRHYFGGMARHLANLRPSLRPGARLAYVVGDQASFFRILIRTGNILAEMAEHFGYRVDGIELFRTRHATATRATLREEVVLLSWPR